ncbi:STN domain-containing protein, partial [Listeria seeligeri]|uniref:STN domain-containing protein n=1 Tax=Listeria seeligeri TaxID=1640 RepID=UPI0022EABDB5
ETPVSAPIAAQPLSRALEQLSRSSGVQFLYSAGGDARMAGAVPRGATVRQALDALLAGTGLRYRYLNATTVTIEAQDASAPAATSALAAPEAVVGL